MNPTIIYDARLQPLGFLPLIDFSGNSNHANGDIPVNTAGVINGQPAFVGDGSTADVLTPSIPAAQVWSALAVVQPTLDDGATLLCLADYPGSNPFYLLETGGEGHLIMNLPQGGFDITSIANLLGKPVGLIFEGGPGGLIVTDHRGGIYRSSALPCPKPLAAMRFFARGDGRFFTGAIGHFTYQPDCLIPDEKTAIMARLVSEWGLA